MVNSVTVYTFSFTLLWFHTVYAVPDTHTAVNAPTRRTVSLGVNDDRMRCTTRNQKNAAPALMNAENRLMRTATESPSGDSSSSHARASSTNSGFPGGWGMPRMCAVAMYSLVSQNAVVGARVRAYRMNSAAADARAHRYGGRWWTETVTGSARAEVTRAVCAAWLMKPLGREVRDLDCV